MNSKKHFFPLYLSRDDLEAYTKDKAYNHCLQVSELNPSPVKEPNTRCLFSKRNNQDCCGLLISKLSCSRIRLEEYYCYLIIAALLMKLLDNILLKSKPEELNWPCLRLWFHILLGRSSCSFCGGRIFPGLPNILFWWPFGDSWTCWCCGRSIRAP